MPTVGIPDDRFEVTDQEWVLIQEVYHTIEKLPLSGTCADCGRGKLYHLLNPTKCYAMVQMLKERLGL